MSLSNPKELSMPHPVTVINGYVWHAMKQMDPNLEAIYTTNGQTTVPIFPISDSLSGTTAWKDKAYMIYNQMHLAPTSPFYPIKRDRFLYGVKGDVGQSMEWLAAMSLILDRQDDAAKDINEWNKNNPRFKKYHFDQQTGQYIVGDNGQRTFDLVPVPVYFHNLRIYQIGGTDPHDYTAKPFMITDIIADARYHLTESMQTLFPHLSN